MPGWRYGNEETMSDFRLYNLKLSSWQSLLASYHAIWRNMAQCEQKKAYFKANTEGEQAGYLDLAACATAMNRKQYHQVANSGNPNCYRVRVTAVKGSTIFKTIQNQFLICRAIKQVAKGWKAQMRHAGIKLRDLPPYGRRARFALETGAYDSNTLGIVGEKMFENSTVHLEPCMEIGSLATSEYFVVYTATDGKDIHFRHSSGAGDICANQITQVTVTDGAGLETNQPLVVCGTGANEFNVIREYLKARRQTPDVSIDTPGPATDSAMLNLFSTAEEMSDDIIDAIDDYMDYKPYTPDHKTNTFDDLFEACSVDQATTATTQWPYVSEVIDVPLGLLKIDATPTAQFSVELLAIYEM